MSLLLVGTSYSAEDTASLNFFRDVAQTRDYRNGRPVSPKITSDGRSVVYLRSGPRDSTLKLFEFNLATKTERELLAPDRILGGTVESLSVEEKARRERQRQSARGFTHFEISEDGARLLVILAGKLYLVARATLQITPLPGSDWIDPRFSPDGNSVAAVGPDRELHVIDLTATVPAARAITSGATATLAHGIAEFVAQEEMGRFEGYWWSPDSSHFLVQQTDESQVELRYVADPLHPETAPAKFFYPRAGTANAVVQLFLVSADGGPMRPVEWDNTALPYLASVRWPTSGPLTLLVQNREQTEEYLLAVDPETGVTRVLVEETDEAWVNLAPQRAAQRPPLWIEEGTHFLWTTESRGAWQVDLRDAEGIVLREITPTDFHFRRLIGVDETSGTVWVEGGTDPRESHVWSFPLNGGSGQPFTRGRGIHTASAFAKSAMFVQTSDLFDGTYRVNVIDANGDIAGTLPSVAETPKAWPRVELTRVGSRDLDAAVTRPQAFTAGKKYPVLLKVYAGPGAKFVEADLRNFLSDQWMADQGYMVVRVDGRGTPWRGRDWERIIKGNFVDVALEDQIAGLRALGAKYPELDLTRVGVTGWSFGGYFAAMATIRRPDVFHAGVAGAPVVTWENYDTHYTERYLGLPQAAQNAYRVSNVTTYAAELRRPLLLIHGVTDDNVYFQHSLQLADALFKAGKPYELLPILSSHLVSDPAVRSHQQARVMAFFDRELKRP